VYEYRRVKNGKTEIGFMLDKIPGDMEIPEIRRRLEELVHRVQEDLNR